MGQATPRIVVWPLPWRLLHCSTQDGHECHGFMTKTTFHVLTSSSTNALVGQCDFHGTIPGQVIGTHLRHLSHRSLASEAMLTVCDAIAARHTGGAGVGTEFAVGL